MGEFNIPVQIDCGVLCPFYSMFDSAVNSLHASGCSSLKVSYSYKIILTHLRELMIEGQCTINKAMDL